MGLTAWHVHFLITQFLEVGDDDGTDIAERRACIGSEGYACETRPILEDRGERQGPPNGFVAWLESIRRVIRSVRGVACRLGRRSAMGRRRIGSVLLFDQRQRGAVPGSAVAVQLKGAAQGRPLGCGGSWITLECSQLAGLCTCRFGWSTVM